MTQSGGQAAGIQLQVGLDLAYFRNQLPLLSKEAAGRPLTFGVRFNRQDIVTQFRTLDRYVNNKKFNIEIKSNLKAEIKAAKELSSLLKSMPAGKPGTPGAIYNRTAGTEVRTAALNKLLRSPGAGGFDATQIKKLAEAAIKAGIEGIDINASATTLRSTLRDAFQQAGDDSSRGLINALTNGRTAVGKAAAGLAEETLNALRTSLQTQSPSKKTEKIGRDVGKGFEIGSVDAMNDAFDALEALTGRRLRRLKAQFAEGARGALAISSGQVSRVSVSDVTPRNFERIAGSSIRGALPPGVDRSAETLQDFYRSLDQIGIALASTIDSSERAADAFKTLRNALDSLIDRAKILASEQSLQARLRPSSVPSGMPLLTGRAPGRALPMLPAAAQRPERFTSQEKLFKDFLGRTIKAVIPESGSAAIGRSLFGGTQFREIGNAMRRPQLGAGIDTEVETVAVKDLTLASRNIAAATNDLKAQKLLPAAGGTSASQMIRQVLSGLPPLKAPRIGAQNISPRGSLGQFPMEGMAYPSSPIGSMGRFPMDPMLAVGGASAVGQKIAGPYPFSNTARSARGGYFPGISSSLRFPMEGMIGPSSPIGRITPQSSMFGAGGPPGGPPRPPSGGGGMGGAGSFGRALGGINLPGTGVVREIGNEFAMATKQVLLFGTAYKALAFFTSFPAQVGQAVGALQSFNNTLKAISPTADEARASNQFILDIVDRYNVPLQSARDGFTKLYASMAPAGFKGDEIRALFTGVSQAAATFGMSADKVDRVNYAFAQMASKGQVMSEELKGQLGDVLPGAMGIFAKAAGFEGTDAIQKFSKALEEGAYKGKPMRDLLKNVSIELTKEFGPGAEGAARTFQGAINRMQNSTKLLYEAFEPVAVGFLNSVVVPLTSGIKTITDGFNAFFTSTQAKTAGGMAFAQELEKLRPTFEGIRTNVATLLPVLQTLGGVLLEVGKVFLQIAGNPFVGYLARVYLSVLPLVTIIKVLNLQALIPMIGSLLRAIPAFITFNSLMLQGNRAGLALKTTTFLLGTTASVTAGKVRLVGAALLSLGMPAVLLGIGALIERFMMLKGAVDGVRQSTQQMVGSISSLANTGAVREIKNIGADTQKQIATFKGLRPFVSGGLGNAPQRRLTEDAAKKMEELGLGAFVSKGVTGPFVNDFLNASKIIEERLKGLGKTADSVREKMPLAEKAAAALAKQAKQGIEPIDAGVGGDQASRAAADKAAADAARRASQQQQNAIDAANLQNALDRARYDGLTALGDQAFQHAINLIDARNNYELAGLDSIASRQEKFQQDLQKIELDRIDTVRQATQKAVEASLKFAAAQNTAVAAGTGKVQGGGTGLFQGSTGISSGPHFDVRRADGGRISEAEARALFSEEVRRQLTMTSGYGPRRAPAPGASTFHRGIDLAGPANTPLSLAPGYSLMGVGQEGGLGYAASVQGPQGQSYKVGHLQKPGVGYTMQRREAKAGGNLQVEQLERSNALEEASLIAINATTEALAKRKALIASNINTIFPVAEQRLQNDLTKIRNDLQLKGMPKEYIDYQEDSYKASYEMSEAIKKNEEDTKKYQKSVDALQGKQAKGIALTADETSALTFYTGAIAQNKEALNDLAKQQVEYNIVALEGAIAAMKNADALKAQQETMDLIKSSVESASSSYKGFIKEMIMGGDPKEALKKFQEAITDQVLTITLDFVMKPVEKIFKDQLSALFGVPTEEKARQDALAKMEQQLAVQRSIDASVTKIATGTTASGLSPSFAPTSALSGSFDASNVFGPIAQSTADTLGATATAAQEGLADINLAYGSSVNFLGQAAQEAGVQSNNFGQGLGKAVGAIGGAAGAVMGIAAGIGQISQGSTSGVLGGLGSIFMTLGGAFGGIGGLFGGGGGLSSAFGSSGPTFNPAAFAMPRLFANGGVVNGPTLGLVGEGRYNEAIVPLPDGRSIPVQMQGNQQPSRDLLANQRQQQASMPSISMSFQTSTINGVEYVSRDQLEQAMAATRRQAAADGASRGMTMTLDKLQQSPSTRSRLGIGGR